MNTDWVKEKVAEIKSIAADDEELAHIKEDNLHVGVLKAIASGNHDARNLAYEALKTEEIDFNRWHA